MNDHQHALYLVHALTPLRVGADQGIGAIDLPTLREAHTGWPILPGSSVKGVLREQAEVHFGRNAPEVRGIFGPPTEHAGDFRGGMVFGDAYPVLLPVRSLAGTFAWVTCDQVLRRLERDAKEAGWTLERPQAPAGQHARVPGKGSEPSSDLLVDGSQQQKHVLLEDICLHAVPDPALTSLGKVIAGWAWPLGEAKEKEREQAFLLHRLVLVPDDVFGYFCRHRLEIRARVAIEHTTGTVGHGPWTEELIPAETLLCGIMQARGTALRTRRSSEDDAGRNVDDAGLTEPDRKNPDVVFKDLRALLREPRVMRLGGHASVGLGRARVTLTPRPSPVTKPSGKDSRR